MILVEFHMIPRTTHHFMFIFAFIMIIVIFSIFFKNDLGGYGDDDWNGD